MKQLLLVVALLGLMAAGYLTYQKRQLQAAQPALASAHQTISQLRAGAQNPDAEANAAVSGDKHPAPLAPVAKASAPANPKATPAVVNNPRPEIEAALKEMHVTTLMPGSPGVFIIGKQDYSEGEDLPLPKGRKARIVAVQDDGVQLTCEGMAFRLDPPVAPDLAALRKKK